MLQPNLKAIIPGKLKATNNMKRTIRNQKCNYSTSYLKNCNLNSVINCVNINVYMYITCIFEYDIKQVFKSKLVKWFQFIERESRYK